MSDPYVQIFPFFFGYPICYRPIADFSQAEPQRSSLVSMEESLLVDISLLMLLQPDFFFVRVVEKNELPRLLILQVSEKSCVSEVVLT